MWHWLASGKARTDVPLDHDSTTINTKVTLPGPWGPPRSGLIPLPIRPSRRKYVTNLLSLAADLPKTPLIDALAAPPWKLDFAAPAFSSNHRTCHGEERKDLCATIRSITAHPSNATIFSRGTKSNWNRDDDQQLAAGIVVVYRENSEIRHSARNLGFTATDFDADMCALAAAANQAQLFLNQHPNTPQITIFATNPTSGPIRANLSLESFATR
jgi:hypothetical protein